MAKICIVSPSLKIGGIERALVTLANEFHRLGHDIEFVICLKGNEFYELENGVKIHKPNFQRDKGYFNKILFYPRLLRYIRHTVNFIKADCVLVYGDWFSPVTLLALLKTNHQVYISDRTIPNYRFSWVIRFLKRWLYPKSAGFIAQTTRSAVFKKKQFGDQLKIKIIPNALPELKMQIKETKNDEKAILYVGRFAWEKDPEILIRAFKLVLNECPDLKLRMAGDGPLIGEMKNITKDLGIDVNVEFLGKVKDINRLYETALIYVLPSVVEGFPNSLIEAMSFGLPCICFSDIPYEDIITSGINGKVVHGRSEINLANAILDMIVDPNIKKMGEMGRERTNSFQKQHIAMEILNFMKLT